MWQIFFPHFLDLHLRLLHPRLFGPKERDGSKLPLRGGAALRVAGEDGGEDGLRREGSSSSRSLQEQAEERRPAYTC